MCLAFRVHVQLTVSVINIPAGFLPYRTKSDVKMKQNYMANMIMNVSGMICQLIGYQPDKHIRASLVTVYFFRNNK